MALYDDPTGGTPPDVNSDVPWWVAATANLPPPMTAADLPPLPPQVVAPAPDASAGAPPPGAPSFAAPAGPPDLQPPGLPGLPGGPPLPPPPGTAPDAAGSPAPISPMPTPDALSSATGQPAAGQLGGMPYAAQPTDPQQLDQVMRQYAGRPWDIPAGIQDEATRDRVASWMAVNRPDMLLEIQNHQLAARRSAEAAQRMQIEADNLAHMKQDLADRQRADAITQAKSDQIVNDAMQMSQRGLDRGRWFRNLSTAGLIGTIGNVVIGGLLQGANGGRNTGMDWVTGQIDKDVEDQKADLENQREGIKVRQGAVAQEFSRTGNLYQATETVRLASYQTALNQLATQQQDFDPRGTSYSQLGTAMQQLVGAQQASIANHQKEMNAQTLAALKEDRESAAQLEVARHNRAEEAKGWAQLSFDKDKQKAAGGEVLPAQEIARRFQGLPASAIPPQGATVEQVIKIADAYNKTTEAGQKLAGTQIQGPDGQPLTVDGKPGSAPVAVATPKLAEDINKQVAGAQDLLTSLGNVRRFLATDPRATDRDAWGAAKADLKVAEFAFAQLHDTKASSKELDAMVDLFGPDFDGYLSRVKDKGVSMAHIDTVMRAAETSVNNTLRRQAKYTGPAIVLNPSKPGDAEETDDDRDEKELLKADRVFYNYGGAAPDGVDEGQVIGRRSLPENFDPSYFASNPREAGRPVQGVSLRQERIFDKLQADLAGPDVETHNRWIADLARPEGDTLRTKAEQESKQANARRDAALNTLGVTAGTKKEQPGAPNPLVREAARRLLQSIVSTGAVPDSPERVR